MAKRGKGGKRLVRQPAYDIRELKELLYDTWNEIGVGIGEEFLIVHPDAWPKGAPKPEPRRR